MQLQNQGVTPRNKQIRHPLLPNISLGFHVGSFTPVKVFSSTFRLFSNKLDSLPVLTLFQLKSFLFWFEIQAACCMCVQVTSLVITTLQSRGNPADLVLACSCIARSSTGANIIDIFFIWVTTSCKDIASISSNLDSVH